MLRAPRLSIVFSQSPIVVGSPEKPRFDDSLLSSRLSNIDFDVPLTEEQEEETHIMIIDDNYFNIEVLRMTLS